MSNIDLSCGQQNSVAGYKQDKELKFNNYPLIWIGKIKSSLVDVKYKIYVNKPNFSFEGIYLEKYKVEDVGDKTCTCFEYQVHFIINSQSGFYTKPENICNIASDFKSRISDVDENVIIQFSVFNLNQKDNDYYGEMVLKIPVSFPC